MLLAAAQPDTTVTQSTQQPNPPDQRPLFPAIPLELHLLMALSAILLVDRLFGVVFDRLTKYFRQPHVGVSPAVSSSLYQVLHTTKADRAYIALFHNGINTVTGLRFVRFSVFYEASKPDAGSYAGLIQNTSLSRAHREYHDCMNDPDRIAVYSRSEVNPGCRQVLDRFDSQTMAVHVFVANNGLPYGFLGLHYVEEQDAVKLKERLIQTDLNIQINRLSHTILQQGSTTFWRSMPNRIRALFGRDDTDPFSFLDQT